MISRVLIVQASLIGTIILVGSGIIIFIIPDISIPSIVTTPSSGLSVNGDVNLEVYWDAECEKVVDEIDWGVLRPSQMVNITVFVWNKGSESMHCDLTWNETSWWPRGASRFFQLSWNFGQEPLSANHKREIILSLIVGEDIQDVDDFRFDIIIFGKTEN